MKKQLSLTDKIAALEEHYGPVEAARKIGVEYITLYRWRQGRSPSRHVAREIEKAYRKMETEME